MNMCRMSGISSYATYTQAHLKSSSQRGTSGCLCAAGGRFGLDPKCRVTIFHTVTSLSPGSSAGGYWKERVLLLCPVLVPFSCSTVGMKTAQQTERVGWGFGVQIPSESSGSLHGRHKALSRHLMYKHLQLTKRCKQTSSAVTCP